MMKHSEVQKMLVQEAHSKISEVYNGLEDNADCLYKCSKKCPFYYNITEDIKGCMIKQLSNMEEHLKEN